MTNMAILAQRLSVGGVQDERKQFLDLSLMVGVLRRVAATFAGATSICQHRSSPIPCPSVGVDKAVEILDVTALPVRVSLTKQVRAHPLPLARLGTEVVLRVRNTCWWAAHNLAAVFTGNLHHGMTPTPTLSPARLVAVIPWAGTGCCLQWFATGAAEGFVGRGAAFLLVDFRAAWDRAVLLARAGNIEIHAAGRAGFGTGGDHSYLRHNSSWLHSNVTERKFQVAKRNG